MELHVRSHEQASNLLSSIQVKTPPHELRVWVGGQNEETFEIVGKNVSLNLFDAIESNNILQSSSNVLDFGCGCGRVLRYFSALYPKARYYGVDPDPIGLNWCKENLNDLGTFVQTSTRPPLPFDQIFDFVYATSVFTHLSEEVQYLWLEELRRVTKPGGYLVISTHGENIENSPNTLMPNEKEMMAKYGIWFRDRNSNLIGKDYLDMVWHSVSYVEKNWSKYFEIVKHIDKGINGHQDLILLKRT
jgi:SAM-dependent methyltransferase